MNDLKGNGHRTDGECGSGVFYIWPASSHIKISELVLERALRLEEDGRDVIILMDGLTRLADAYNLTIPPSGRTLSGGIDPAALSS